MDESNPRPLYALKFWRYSG